MAQRHVLTAGGGTSSKVTTKILNLEPGKKYMVTFKLASTIRLKNGQPTQYAPGAYIDIPGTIGGFTASTTLVDLAGKEAEWVTKTIAFQAQDTEAEVIVAPNMLKNGVLFQDTYLSYLHVFIPQNAVIEQIP